MHLYLLIPITTINFHFHLYDYLIYKKGGLISISDQLTLSSISTNLRNIHIKNNAILDQLGQWQLRRRITLFIYLYRNTFHIIHR